MELHDISIHAPAKGATLPACNKAVVSIISIHAPAKGATWAVWSMAEVCKFQSTHPRRVRLTKGIARVENDIISIHAPAKGATRDCYTRPRRQAFQSTHPRRVRRCTLASLSLRSNFNPRTREGCDDKDFESDNVTKISIHAPAKGATCWCV